MNLVLRRVVRWSLPPSWRVRPADRMKAKETDEAAILHPTNGIRTWLTACLVSSWFAWDHFHTGLRGYFGLGLSNLLLETRLRVLRKNLWPCIGAHMAYNMYVLLFKEHAIQPDLLKAPPFQRAPLAYLAIGTFSYVSARLYGSIFSQAIEWIERKLNLDETDLL